MQYFVYNKKVHRKTMQMKILDSLREAGYREKGMFVPFSNGEEILDLVLAAKWERIKK